MLFLLHILNDMLYPDCKDQLINFSPVTIFKYGIIQRVFGFNRKVPWPVHWTSCIKAVKKIVPGSRFPGMSRSCYLDGRNGIKIGNNVWIGPGVSIISMNHHAHDFQLYKEERPVSIGDNCWLGSNSIILPGVCLGEHTIVGAGAVVTKSFPNENQVLGGNPARVVKQLSPYGNAPEMTI